MIRSIKKWFAKRFDSELNMYKIQEALWGKKYNRIRKKVDKLFNILEKDGWNNEIIKEEYMKLREEGRNYIRWRNEERDEIIKRTKFLEELYNA